MISLYISHQAVGLSTEKEKGKVLPWGVLGSWLAKAVESCTVAFLEGHFLFTCSDTFAVGCIV